VSADSVPLVQELEGRRIRTVPRAVTVRVAFHPPQKLYVLADVPIHFLCPAGLPLRPCFGEEQPGKITLRVLGPSGQTAPAVLAFVDLSGQKWQPGSYEELLRVQLPSDFQLAPGSQRTVAFQLLATDSGGQATGIDRQP